MNSKECEEQLKSLIEHFKNGGLDFNATDIKAIEHLLLENKIQQDTIKEQKQENKELHNKIGVSIGILKTWKDFCEVKRKYCIEKDKEHWTYCIEKIEGLEEVLKDSDVDE